jgi:prolyl oligopeptidase
VRALGRLQGDPATDGVRFALTGWLQPRRAHAVTADGRLVDLGAATVTPADFGAITVTRLEVPSHDGVGVPLTILHRRDLPLDGTAPIILWGYGIYGIPFPMSFDPMRLAWLERGGVIAVAHVRGGGEKGEGWHAAGRGALKPNSMRDFYACAEQLVARGYGRRDRLSAWSRSGGGILIGRAITERPELFGSAVIGVGWLQVVRYLHEPNGPGQEGALGARPDDPAGFRALLAMDAYHNVREGVAYPPVLLTHGLRDNRVAPWQSGKFGARLAATGNPVWLRIEPEAGHGLGSTRAQLQEELADSLAFALNPPGMGATRRR